MSELGVCRELEQGHLRLFIRVLSRLGLSLAARPFSVQELASFMTLDPRMLFNVGLMAGLSRRWEWYLLRRLGWEVDLW